MYFTFSHVGGILFALSKQTRLGLCSNDYPYKDR